MSSVQISASSAAAFPSLSYPNSSTAAATQERARTVSLVRPFYPALDGLRAVAFLTVFGFHTVRMLWKNSIFNWGWMGVDMFFVLSGFLITGILYDSLQMQAAVPARANDFFRNFYVRRALRIFPLFYSVFAVLLLATPLLHIHWDRYNLAMALYLGNFFEPGALAGVHPSPGIVWFAASHAGEPQRSFVLQHFWSLCVEEQFYLIWPTVVWLVRSRRALLRLCLVFVVAMPFARAAFFALHPSQVWQGSVYYLSYFRFDTLLLGAAAALWLRGPAPAPQTIRRSAAALFPIAVGLLALGYSLESSHPALTTAYDRFVSTYGYSLVALAALAVLLLAIDEGSPLQRLLRWRPLMYLGRISYGLYVLHLIPLPFVGTFSKRYLAPHHLAWTMPIFYLGFVVVLASLSFRFLESPFLRLKSVLAPQRNHVADPAPMGEADGEPAYLETNSGLVQAASSPREASNAMNRPYA